MKFTWREAKAAEVTAEHGVEFSKIEDIFDDPTPVEFIDEAHSTATETRYAMIGLTAQYGLVYLVFTEPTPDEVHYITARRAEKWMVDEYEENKQRW